MAKIVMSKHRNTMNVIKSPNENISLFGVHNDCVCTSGAVKSKSGCPIFDSRNNGNGSYDCGKRSSKYS
ncbi:hypothetical protein DERF_007578 [Dermatophagoides farinae]|uniref:Uncharacterized protein n=1 Tax=Dermatophagoides farinae TaxID=6954 RepID=A0A922HYG4_DERFA|nr:hypothetical protein DERF_007578 [Dermatophagoides farinae]